jgi:hypothetical protein
VFTIRFGVMELIGFSYICLKNNLKAQEWLGPFEYFKLFFLTNRAKSSYLKRFKMNYKHALIRKKQIELKD